MKNQGASEGIKSTWKDKIWCEELTGMERFNLVQEVCGLCTAQTGSKTDESMQAGENGYERVGKCLDESEDSMRERFLPKMRQDGKLKGNEEESPGRSAKTASG